MTGLPVDYKVDKIIKSIQAEIKTEFDIDVPFNTVIRLIEAQVKATAKGMAEGQTIVWKYLGTFVATKARVQNLNKKYINRGKKPTLVDAGFARVTFNGKGTLIAESTFESTSKRDYYEKPNQ